MRIKLLLISLLACMVATAQKQYNVLDWKSEYTVNTFLVQKMHEQYAKRKAGFANAVKSKSKTLVYVEEVRKKFLRLLGDLPAHAALHPQITGLIQADEYHIEKLVYESYKDHHVTASLYVPNGKGPFPAALLFCGHEDQAKATVSYQQTAALFAKNGFVVLIIDPISQGERYQLTDSIGKPLTRGGTTGHTLLNAISNLLGTSAPAFELLDNSCGLDYLLTRKEVDSSRIGCMGNSGGGMQAIYFAAFDKRVKVIVPCSYLATRERTMEISGAADGCAQIPDEGKEQLEMVDLLIAAAPKPVLVLAGRYDFIDYTGTTDAYAELRQVYRSLEQPGKVSLYTVDDGHGISRPKREAAVTWFRKWMYGDSTYVHEKETKLNTDKDLFVLNKPQVNASYPDEISIPTWTRSAYELLAAGRSTFLRSGKENIIKKVADLLRINNNQQIETAITGNYANFDKVIIRKKGGLPVPVLIAYPKGRSEKCILWLPGNGKARIADSAALIDNYLRQNYTVVIADLSGIGETEDKAELNDPKYYNKEYRNAMLALHLGLPMIGQRTTDILSITDMIQAYARTLQQPIEVHASGNAALPALHAALFQKNIEAVFIHGDIPSFKTMLDNPTQKDMYSNVIPSVLRFYDIPDLVNLLPGKIHLR